ncbi:MAG TPA: TolC family protein [Bdellovibrionales bacterium]|nr:TolC family protein [Bdellovibrionales bacterium]
MKKLLLGALAAMTLTSSALAQENVKPKTRNPRLSEALLEAIQASPSIEAAEASLGALRASRLSVLLSLGSFNFSKTNNFGKVTTEGLILPGNSSHQQTGVSVTISPAAIWAFKKLGPTVKAQEMTLAALRQDIALELAKVWLDFYNASGTAYGLKQVLKSIETYAKKIEESDSPTKENDLLQLRAAGMAIESRVLAYKGRIRSAAIAYERIMGHPPKVAEFGTPGDGSNGTTDVDVYLKSAKAMLDQVFPLNDENQALAIAENANLQLLAAKYMSSAASTDLWTSRTPWLPTVTISRGRSALVNTNEMIQSQTSVSVNFNLSGALWTEHRAKALEVKAATARHESARRAVRAAIQDAFATLEMLNARWMTTTESFKSATKALKQMENETGKVAEKIQLLNMLVDSWVGESGLTGLSSSILLTKAAAHAQMGSLFDNLETLKKLEDMEDGQQ